MADNEDDIIVKLVVDEKDVDESFARIERKAKNTEKKTKPIKLFDFEKIREEGMSSLDDITGNLGKMGLVAAAVGGAIFGAKKAFDFAIQGEQINAINSQFVNLATNAGIVPEKLRAGLERSNNGLSSMESILRTTNSAMINLGSSAERLPEVLDLARKVTSVMGGDIQTRYEGIVSAIESGNARALKAQGIYVDIDKALRNYAKTLGLNTSELNESQKQQAVLNATLTEGAEKFKDVQTSVQPIKDITAQISSNMSQVVDNIRTAIAESTTFRSVLEGAKFFTTVMAKGVGEAMKVNVSDQLAKLVAERAEIQKQLDKVGNGNDGYWNFGSLQSRLAVLNSQIKALGGTTEETSNVILFSNAKAAASEKAAENALKGRRDAAQEALFQSRRLAVETAKIQNDMMTNTSEIAKTALIKNEWDRRSKLLELYHQRSQTIEAEQANRLRELELQRQGGAIQTTEEYEARKLAIVTQYAGAIQTLQLQQTQAMMEYTATASEGISAFDATFAGFGEILDGAKGAAKDFALNAAGNFRNMGKQMFQSIGSGAAQAFSAFGTALINGENSLEAFGNALLSQMGQMAVQLGTQFILQGAAYMWAGMPNGPALMAAGAALAAFGGILSGVAAQGQGSSSGGGVKNDPATANAVEPEKMERKAPETNISVIVQGDVFDSEGTGLRIADIINTQFSQNGVKIVGVT
nr:hypothetical protein CKG001_10200 [Bdellovibrio sp. CKG001]